MSELRVTFHCRYCAFEIGTTDGLRLMIACLIAGEQLIITFNDLTKPHCPKCNRLTPWYPVRSQAKNADAIKMAIVV